MRWTVDRPASGAVNMDLDRRLWQAAERGESADVLLRVYRWSPPAISLGFHQPESAVDATAARALGVDIVRRPTGGAAVLHWNEWTYAVVAPLGMAGLGKQVAEIYHAVGGALVAALRAEGVDAALAGSGRPAAAACFAAIGGHEIQAGGRKLVGSALRRGRRAFLQHGSILAGPEHAQLAQLLGPAGTGAETLALERAALQERTTDLAREGRPALGGEALAQRLAAALAACTGLSTQREEDGAALLAAHAPAR